MYRSWTHIEGLVAAPPTPFNDNLEIDTQAVAPLADFLTSQGVCGVFVNGTTGESLSLTVSERIRLAERWRQVLPAGIKLIIHVGHCSLNEAQKLAAHARNIHADAIAIMPPVYFKPHSTASLITWCEHISRSAPALPLFYYHIPSMTGVQLRLSEFLNEAAAKLPDLVGAKFTCEALDDFLKAITLENGRFDILWGRDEMSLAALATGARGAVGSTFNIIAPLHLDLRNAFFAGDLERARTYQRQVNQVVDALRACGSFFSGIKAVLSQQFDLPILPQTRPPLRTLDPGSIEKLLSALTPCLRP
ncbi:MAG: dihydrodipicolinate synthetase [Lentisphaerae bacterium]|nr:MAG: dihydrodipicolinate synthetase [Lentisphaerota bacterium]